MLCKTVRRVHVEKSRLDRAHKCGVEAPFSMGVASKKKEGGGFGCDSLQVLEFNKARVEGRRQPFASFGIGPRASVNRNQMLHPCKRYARLRSSNVSLDFRIKASMLRERFI